MANRPAPEIDLDESFVRTLVQQQFPELAAHDLRPLARGWDNTNFRLGQEHLVRLPHRQAAEPLVISEQRWLPELQPRLDLPIPAPTHCGVPTRDYPWHWSITPWFAGTDAASAPLSDAAETAVQLAQFFDQLHVPAPNDAPTNAHRGGPLVERSELFRKRLAELAERRFPIDIGVLRASFDHALAAPTTTDRLWLHGDLHGRNMVVHEGVLAAVIDWGDICSGDRATDLAAAFMLVPDRIDDVIAACSADDSTWDRARGWAAHFAVLYLLHSDDDPIMGSIGVRLANALA